MNNHSTKYVYKGTEVILTGRFAKRDVETTSSQRKQNSEILEDILYEIVPADPKNGSWSSWVKQEELYTIFERESY